MDTKGFRLKEKNGFFNLDKWDLVAQTNKEVKASGSSVPADDSRYPAYAAVMSDARTFTDYRSHCSSRVPAPYTQAVKEWMIKNGSQIIDMNRRRQAENTGAVFGTVETAPPPATLVFCDAFGCEQEETNSHFGTGIETVNECPELPGTFNYRPDPSVIAANKKNIMLNVVNENGRNSSRRWETGVFAPYS
jgi:hypothetical protein